MGVGLGDGVEVKLSGEMGDTLTDSAGSKLDDAVGAKLGNGIRY